MRDVGRVRGGDEGETGHTRSGFNVCTHKATAEQGEQQEGWNREEEKKHKKEAVNSYLPTLEELESCADVGDPVDPL